MALNRRSLLKTLAMAHASLLTPFSMAAANVKSSNLVDIYLFGLFLMEFQGDNLIIVTPKYKHHRFCIVYPGQTPIEMPEYLNLWDLLVPGQQDTFCTENLRFPAKAIRNGGFVLDPHNPSKHKHRCTMVLPKPLNISVGRQQDASKFHPDPGSKIGKLIQEQAGAKLGSITHLQYESRLGKSSQFAYVVSHHPLSLHTVNCALRAARNPCGKGFDLKMHDIPKVTCTGTEIKCPDWDNLTELLNFKASSSTLSSNVCPLNVDVGSCPQFGIQG